MTTTTVSESGRRERKKLATREALRSAAFDLFGEKDFHTVTVDEICARADVAVSTFFRHFSSKEDVVLGDFDLRGDAFFAALDDQPTDVGFRDLVLGALAQWQSTRRDIATLEIEAELISREPALLGALVSMLQRWEGPIATSLARRYRRPAESTEVRFVAAGIATAIRLVLDQWNRAPDSDIFTIALDAVDRLAPSLATLLD